MTPHDFIAKWKNGGDERRDFQPFFEDLCRLLGHKTPREADPNHEWFTYEYGANKTSGGNGWADVWKKGHFGWEAKGTHKDLAKAYQQLKMYADALENPPLLIVSDLQRFEIHTNFTATVKKVYEFTVEDLADQATRRLLSAAFNDPQQLKPGTSRAAITEEAAGLFAALAEALRKRHNDPHAVAHFLNRLLFCMFAEDIGLLPEHVFTKLVTSSQGQPDKFETRTAELFAAMKDGGDFALNAIEWFNGGLFEDAATLRLESPELETINAAAKLDWSEIDPSIFGTLFERGLDPAKRSQLGAHYTDPATIMKIVGPVVVDPLAAEWEREREAITDILAKSKVRGIPKAAQQRFNAFLERLRSFRVLDPACGSGNFLFVALRALKDLEQHVIFDAETMGLPRQVPGVGPANVLGIELNEYAAELARITVWIGEIQWMISNGYGARRNPILRSLGGIENRDALVNDDGSEAQWPHADAIVGNPPFVGNKKLIRELTQEYVDRVRKAYQGKVEDGVDLVCYWFAKAHDALVAGVVQRAGLVATSSIRGGTNREVIRRIAKDVSIFDAWSDEDWWDKGTAVRVSMVCFGQSGQPSRLNGIHVSSIYPDLTAGEADSVDVTRAKRLVQNAGLCFQGAKFGGPFEIDSVTALTWLGEPNVNGRSNSEVLRHWINGMDIVRRPGDGWVIDFGTDTAEEQAAYFELPYKHLKQAVVAGNERREASAAKVWWRHQRPRPEMRAALRPLSRWIATPEVSKHRVFAFLPVEVLPSGSVYAIAREDDTSFGVLHSRIHEVWSLKQGTSLEDRPRYTPSTTLETFPFPAGLTPDIPARDYASDARAQRIAACAVGLLEARDRWLNPPEWVEWVRSADEAAAGFPARPVAKPGHETALKKRTLTNLYNERPAWLANLHDALDKAVADAYGWEWPLSDGEVLRRLFALNQERSGMEAASAKAGD